MNELKQAIESAGGVQLVASACGVTPRALYKWLTSGFLPRTEYTGETQYAETISALAKDRGAYVDAAALRASSTPKKTAA